MENNGRWPGYYRVKYNGTWRIAELTCPPFHPENLFWFLDGRALGSEDFEEIDFEHLSAEPPRIKEEERYKTWRELIDSGELGRLIDEWIKNHPLEFKEMSEPSDDTEPIHIPTDLDIDAMSIKVYPHHPADFSSLTHDKYVAYMKGMKAMRDYLIENNLI